MSAAEVELARLAEDFHFSVNPDLGQLESRIQQEIDLNRSKVRVAADVSGEGVDASRHEQATESQLAAEALREFEQQLEPGSAAVGTGIEASQHVEPARTKVTESL